MERIVFVTFADHKYRKSLFRLKNQVAQCKYITDIYAFTEKDLGKDFWHDFHPWLYRRGYGYWKWKSYIVKRVLANLDVGDVLIWSDVGNVFNILAENRLVEYINIVKKSKSGLLTFSQDKIERNWTKADCFYFFGVQENREIIDTFQYWAGCFFVCKNQESIDFIDKWEYVVNQHFDLVTDKSSVIHNYPDFIEHRHDQSIFSILAKLYHADAYPPKEINKENFSNIPIQPKRFKQKNIYDSIKGKCLIPFRYCIGLYLKKIRHFYFRNRIAW